MKLYRIKDWEKYYEVSDSKKVSGPLQWVAVRTKTDGFGYLRITQENDRSDLLAAWYLMLGIAAKQPRAERGKLSRDGIPLTPKDLELMTRFPAQVFERAMVFFSDPKQGWLESDETGRDPDQSELFRTPSESSGSTVQYIQDSTNNTSPAGAGRPEKDQFQIRSEMLFNRRVSTPWSAAELRAWKTAKAVVADTDADSWQLIEWWYALPPEKAPYRKTDFAALLNNWHAEIAKARRHRQSAQAEHVRYAPA